MKVGENGKWSSESRRYLRIRKVVDLEMAGWQE